MFCQNCGKELSDQASFCPNCGHPMQGGSTKVVNRTGKPVSPHSRLAAILMCVFIGALGVHRFYVGKIGTGIAMIFTLGGLGIWVLVDLIMIAAGSFTDVEGRAVVDWQV
jgi:TM2 domain-containing membrane protein YozV